MTWLPFQKDEQLESVRSRNIKQGKWTMDRQSFNTE